MKIKVCGMKYEENIRAVATLPPDYLGFIFYPGSKRFFTGTIPQLPNSIKKTGVFVNETVAGVSDAVSTHELSAVQLHGDESAAFCESISKEIGQQAEIIKAFAIGSDFDFKSLHDYAPHCDFFLFDAKGKLRGGNGTLFDWKVLEQYNMDKPFFLSGGIGLQEAKQVKAFLKTPVGVNCYCIDVNSKFEDGPGFKKIKELRKFIEITAK